MPCNPPAAAINVGDPAAIGIDVLYHAIYTIAAGLVHDALEKK